MSVESPNRSITFEVLTLFPEAVEQFAAAGLLGRASERGLVQVRVTNVRAFAGDKHRTVDDSPFGGGAGMVMKPEPVVAALEAVEAARGRTHRVLVTPSAPQFDQRAAERLAKLARVSLLCGRYEGIDDRVREHFVDECFSLGDFILGGGEVAALAIIEAVSRLREGVVGNPESVETESFAIDPGGAALEHPQYTRPANFRGHEVPAVLLGGDHGAIARWRRRAALRRTAALRPDLCPPIPLSPSADLHLVFDAGAEPPEGLAHVLRARGVTSVGVIGESQSRLAMWVAALDGRFSVAMFPSVRQLSKRLRQREGVAPRVLAIEVADAANRAEPGPGGRAAVLRELADAGRADASVVVVMPGVSLRTPPDALLALAATDSRPQGAETQRQSLATDAAIADASRPTQPSTRQIDRALAGLCGPHHEHD